jgi:hypothetical protein
MKDLNKGSRSLGKDLNPGPPEYDRVLTTQQRLSVNSDWDSKRIPHEFDILLLPSY